MFNTHNAFWWSAGHTRSGLLAFQKTFGIGEKLAFGGVDIFLWIWTGGGRLQ